MDDANKPEPAEPASSTDAAAPVESPDGPPPDPVALRKRAIIGLVSAIAIGAAATAIAYYAEANAGWVARVDGARVTKTEYERMLAGGKKQYAQRFNVDFDGPQGRQMEADLRGGLINQLVERELIRAEAKKRGLTVAPDKVQAKVTQIRGGFKDAAEFEKQLKVNAMTMADFERQVADMVEVEAVVDAVTRDVGVTDAEVRAYYDQNKKMYDRPDEVRARHVLVKDEAKARRIQAQAQAGADFAALAKAHSEDRGSQGEGGDLGYFGRGRMVKEFEDAAFATKPGQLSPLVKTRFGWHLIKVEDRRAARTQPFDEVKAEIRDNMLSQRRRTAFGDWLLKRRAEARVEYRPGFEPPKPMGQGGPGGPGGASGESVKGHAPSHDEDGHGH